jgi:hypothetical protein
MEDEPSPGPSSMEASVPMAAEAEFSASADHIPPGPSSLREQVIQRAVQSDGHFKHQQRGEPELTPSEKTTIASELLDHKPSVFLSRFGKYLLEEDLAHFPAGDYTIDFYLSEIRQRLHTNKNETVVKNRRFEAMKQLTAQGEYFSDEEMKRRDPLLFEQMIGQFLSDDEINSKVDKTDLRFSNILLNHLEITENNDLYNEQKATEVS